MLRERTSRRIIIEIMKRLHIYSLAYIPSMSEHIVDDLKSSGLILAVASLLRYFVDEDVNFRVAPEVSRISRTTTIENRLIADSYSLTMFWRCSWQAKKQPKDCRRELCYGFLTVTERLGNRRIEEFISVKH